MTIATIKKPLILGILFFLPVVFLLFLYPAQHNYNPLDIVNENIPELAGEIDLKEQITVLAFLGRDPMKNVTAASNLKELIYDKFMGFKKFQVVVVLPESINDELDKLEDFKKELSRFKELEYWRYYITDEDEVISIFDGLLSKTELKEDMSTQHVFIVDKDRNQRGRLDDRTEYEKEKKKELFGLYSYDCIEVSELKNKMSEDMRILFTEYRQKRKGNFNSTTRRAEDLKQNEEN